MNHNVLMCSVLLGLSLTAAATHAAEEFNSIERISLANLSELHMDASHTDVDFVAGNANSLTATLSQTLHSGDQQKCLLSLQLEENGTTVSLRTISPQVSWKGMCRVDRKLVVALDQKALRSAKLEVTHGNLAAQNLEVPEQSIYVAHGGVRVDSLLGEQASLRVSHGRVQVANVTVPELNLHGAHTRMRFGTLISDQLNGKFSHGDVTVTSAEASNLRFDQAHGALEISEHSGTRIAIKNSHGPIKLQGSAAESVSLKNSHGAIYYNGASASLLAKNSHGGVELIQKNNNFQNINGDTKHGNLKVRVPAQSVCNFEAPRIKQLNSEIMKSGSDCKIANAGGELTLSGSHSHVTVSALE